jgi:hypothetical protein
MTLTFTRVRKVWSFTISWNLQLFFTAAFGAGSDGTTRPEICMKKVPATLLNMNLSSNLTKVVAAIPVSLSFLAKLEEDSTSQKNIGE